MIRRRRTDVDNWPFRPLEMLCSRTVSTRPEAESAWFFGIGRVSRADAQIDSAGAPAANLHAISVVDNPASKPLDTLCIRQVRVTGCSRIRGKGCGQPGCTTTKNAVLPDGECQSPIARRACPARISAPSARIRSAAHSNGSCGFAIGSGGCRGVDIRSRKRLDALCISAVSVSA